VPCDRQYKQMNEVMLYINLMRGDAWTRGMTAEWIAAAVLLFVGLNAKAKQ
jgi:hypothetical protein